MFYTTVRGKMKVYLTFLLCIVPLAQAQGNGAIRLYRFGRPSHLHRSGVVQIFHSGLWGNICFNQDWGKEEADVVCRQLGWSGSLSTDPSINVVADYGYDDSPTSIGSVQCANNSFPVLLQCSVTIALEKFCGDDFDVTVVCDTTKLWDSDLVYQGMLRLVDGSYITEGRIEIYCNGKWGTVCDDGISFVEADTFCRQLGYSESIRYDHLILAGNASQPIWLDDVTCGSHAQSCVGQCQKCPAALDHNCVHGEDITVSCSYKDEVGGSNLETCKDASSEFIVNDDELDEKLIVGIAIGSFLLLLLASSIVMFVCIILLCGTKQPKPQEQQQLDLDERKPSPTLLERSEVVQMESSPRMYRKENYYVMYPEQKKISAIEI